MTKTAQLTRVTVVSGGEPETHVSVEVFELVAPGIRRRVDLFDVSFSGALHDVEVVRASAEQLLKVAGQLDADDRVLTEAEARALGIRGL